MLAEEKADAAIADSEKSSLVDVEVDKAPCGSEMTPETLQQLKLGRKGEEKRLLRINKMAARSQRNHKNCKVCHKDVSNVSAHMRKHRQNKKFKCTFCDASFNLENGFYIHIRTHIIEKPFNCKHCGKEFNVKQSLQQHCKVAHQNCNDLACVFCGRVSLMKRNHWRHILVHIRETPYNNCSSIYKRSKCPVCNKDVISLSSHLLTHKQDKPLKCGICHKGFVSKSNLNLHLRSHTLEKPFECQICGKGFAVKVSLSRHCKLVHEKRKEFPCLFCHKYFSSKHSQTNHLLRHIGETPYNDCTSFEPTSKPRSRCQVCLKKVKYLPLHMVKHSNERPFQCLVCDQRFKWKSQLTVHTKIHANEKEFKCKHGQCRRSFARKSHLRQHYKNVHEKCRDFYCIFCNKLFPEKGSLWNHLRLHVGEKPYNDFSSAYSVSRSKSGELNKCNICDKIFKEKVSLDVHIRTHTLEKPFKCNICGTLFSLRGNLLRHCKAVHEKRKKYFCLFCNKLFGTKNEKFHHLLQHIGERPYSCKVCDASFSHTGNLRRHLRTHARNNAK